MWVHFLRACSFLYLICVITEDIKWCVHLLICVICLRRLQGYELGGQQLLMRFPNNSGVPQETTPTPAPRKKGNHTDGYVESKIQVNRPNEKIFFYPKEQFSADIH